MTLVELFVRGLRWEADEVVSVELEPVGGVLPQWEPGAHIDLTLPNGFQRQYSLCGDRDALSWKIAVLREESGRGGSAWMHEALRVGDTLRVEGPRNHFELMSAPSYLFIAGGIGITPILAMVEEAARVDADWRLIYGGRRRSSMAFLPQLMRFGKRVVLAPHDEVGLLDLSVIDETAPETVVYCCGPAALIDAVTARCEQVGRTLRVERFVPIVTAEQARHGSGFEVVLQRSGTVLEVSDGASILDAAEAAGLRPPSSCLEGTCGTCETTVLEGSVDHRDSILTEDERASNKTMMICVSRASTARLVLDL